MPITNYSTLKTAISDWLQKGSQYDVQIPNFIQLAESDILRNLRLQVTETRADLTLATASRYTTLPADFLEMRRIHIETSPAHRIEHRSIDQIMENYESTAGKPDFYAIIGSEIEFNRIPDQAYTAKITYHKKLTALSDSNTTNALLTAYPNIYLYASLLAAQPYTEYDERIKVWKGYYDKAVLDAMATDKKSRYGGGPLTMSIGR